jgi:iron complex outermembrane receptor protein
MRYQAFGAASTLALAVAMAAPGSVLAQETASASRAETVIVTAQKREQDLQTVPLAISVVGGDQISPAVANIENLAFQVPTLNFRRGGTNLDSSLFLRGVGTINFSIAAEPSVATVVDGVVLARAGEAFSDLNDIERIEVLRGPQGTLFGKNASAGVLNIVTRKPGDTFGGEVTIAGFEGREYKARAAVDVPFSETLKSRFLVATGTYDGNIKNLANGETINGYDRWGVRGTVVWDASDKLQITTIGEYRSSVDDCCGEVIATAPTAGPNQAALLSLLSGVNFARENTRQVRHNVRTVAKEIGYGLSVQADYDLASGHTLTSITAYRDWTVKGVREGDWLDRAAAYPGGAFNQLHDISPQVNDTFTQEVRIASPAGERLNYVAGLFYYVANAERTLRRDVISCLSSTAPIDATGLRPCLPGQSTVVSGFSSATFGSEIINYAVFGQADYKITEALTMIGGLRWSYDEVNAYHDRIPNVSGVALGGIVAIPSGYRLSTDDTSLTGKLGLQYVINDDVNVYASYSRGYKGPAFNVFFNQNPSQLNVIEGETADSFEAGVKSAWAQDRVILNFSVFRAEYENFQANSFDTLNGVVVTRLTNAGNISTTGAELDFVLRPTDMFSIAGGFAYTDAQIEEFRDASARLSSARAGERLPLAPEWKVSIGADYRIEPTTLPFNTRLNVQYSYTGEQFSDIGANPLFLIDGYGLIDASVTFTDKNERFALSLIGRNLADEAYTPLITPGGPGGALRFAIPREADRYFGISLKAKFGD